MNLTQVQPDPARRKRRKRVARGQAGAGGKTAGRGQKGQKYRSKVRVGFEGGGSPIYRQLPALRGRSNRAHNIGMFRQQMSIVNVGQLERLESGAEVSPETVLEAGLVSKLRDGLKVLGEGELSRALTVRANAFSATAREKIEKAGGTVEVIEQ